MASKAFYLQHLDRGGDWLPYLWKNSGLPGPRGNIELAQAVAEKGTPALFRSYLALDGSNELTDPQKEYIVFCGILGYGRLISEGSVQHLELLRTYASDPRWRVREAVAMALQRIGMADMGLLLKTAKKWLEGGWLEQRAVAAGLCEPVLLGTPKTAEDVLRILDAITRHLGSARDRTTEGFQALKKGMGYCWSVAAAAAPTQGKRFLEKWMNTEDRDVRWIMRENLRKNRLARMDAAWVETWTTRLETGRKERRR